MASIFSIFKRGLEKSATKLSRAISGVFTGIKAHDASSFEDLEAMLVAADFGLKAATEVTACLKDRYDRGAIATDADLVEAAKQEVTAILRQHAR
jgi:fused signal recognition particle receptor